MSKNPGLPLDKIRDLSNKKDELLGSEKITESDPILDKGLAILLHLIRLNIDVPP